MVVGGVVLGIGIAGRFFLRSEPEAPPGTASDNVSVHLEAGLQEAESDEGVSQQFERANP